MIPTEDIYMMRRPEVCKTLGKAKTAFYADVKDGLFPPPVYVSSRTVAWPSNEVMAVLRARIAGVTETEIQDLVSRLVRKRLEGGL